MKNICRLIQYAELFLLLLLMPIKANAYELVQNRMQLFLTHEKIDLGINASKFYLSNYDAESLRMLRNEIYAYYGYPFKDPKVRPLFYFSNSPYHENPPFHESKIDPRHRTFIDYLVKMGKWRKSAERSYKLYDAMANAATGNKCEISHDYKMLFNQCIRLLAIDHRRNYIIASGKESILLLTYPDAIIHKMIKTTFRTHAAMLSSNGDYLGVKGAYYDKDGRYQPIIAVIDLERAAVLHTTKISSDEGIGGFTFSADARQFLTSGASYDVSTGKQIRQWLLPKTPARLYGVVSDGKLLLGASPSTYYRSLYILDISTGELNVLKEYLDETDENNKKYDFHGCSVSFNGKYVAGLIREVSGPIVDGIVRSTSEELKLYLWKYDNNTLNMIYEQKVGFGSVAVWPRGKSALLLLNAGKLYRYHIEADDSVNTAAIPITGYQNGKVEYLGNYSIETYARYWDLESGKKIWPWYETFDPFEPANQLPLYDKAPNAINLRDYWGRDTEQINMFYESLILKKDEDDCCGE